MKRAALAALLLAAACDPGFEPQYRVTDLRILGVRAEVRGPEGQRYADVVPGDAVQLEVLLANPRAHADVSVRGYACLPDGTDRVPACLDVEALRDPDAVAGEPGVLPLPPAVPGPSGRWRIAVAVPGADDPLVAGALASFLGEARAEPAFRCRLYAELPVLVVAEGGGRREVAVKRVRLTPDPATLEAPLAGAYVRNENPSPPAVFRRPADSGSCAGEPVLPGSALPPRSFLCGGSDAAGPYNVCDAAGTASAAREDPSWQWYATGGEFPDEEGIGNATGATPTFDPPAGPFTLWAIVRDGRGGESWVVLEGLAGAAASQPTP